MIKCPACKGEMSEVLSRDQVLIDLCSSCNSVWFDRGEINHFVDNKPALSVYYKSGVVGKSTSSHSCPRCNVGMFSGKMPGIQIDMEGCAQCGGILLGDKAIQFLTGGKPILAQKRVSVIRKVPRYLSAGAAVAGGVLPRLPSLSMASFGVIGSLYFILFGILVFAAHMGFLREAMIQWILLGVLFTQFVVGPWITDLSLRFLGSLEWVEIEDLPPHLGEFVKKVCSDNKIPLPSIGIIKDSPPNAFTYGRTPWSARLVFTRGVLDLLDETEVRAVVGHEIGHIVHWDFVFMTMAQAVPVILYQVYKICYSATKGRSSGKNDPRALFAGAAVTAYLAYIVSEYMVLYLSRVREYWADRFGAKHCGDPNHLVTALVKIAYGLSGVDDTKDSFRDNHRAVQALGIADPKSSGVMGLYAAQAPMGKVPVSDTKEAMQWDLWNPWAMYYEIQSTHPLTAKRINALAVQSKVMGINPLIDFDLVKHEGYWAEFFEDLFVIALPFIIPLCFVPFLGIKNYQAHLSFYTSLYGVGYFFKTMYSYSFSGFLDATVSSLLKKIKVSSVRGIPVKLTGKVIGRGIPGYVFSKDFVVRDNTGIIFLDYEQPMALFNFWFSIMRTKNFLDHTVTVEGWYRRAPMPFVEIYRITSSEDVSNCYTYAAKLLFGVALMFGGVYAHFFYHF